MHTKRLLPFTSLVLLLMSVLVSTKDTSFVVKSSVSTPAGWNQRQRAPSEHIVQLQIALRQDGVEDLAQLLLEVSDPGHEMYGQHLSVTEVAKVVQTPQETVHTVVKWLDDSNLGLLNISQSASGDWLYLSLPIHALESLIHAQYYVFHNSNGDSVLRTLQWSLPSYVYHHIDLIQPTNNFLLPRPQSRYGGFPPPQWEIEHRLPTYAELVDEDVIQRHHITAPTPQDLPSNPTVEQACNRLAVTPLCLGVLYETHGYHQLAADNNSIAMVNFLGQSSNRSDIQLFLERSRPDAAAAGAAYAFKTQIVAAGEDQQTRLRPDQLASRLGLEGALDAQTILGLSWPTPLIVYNVGSKPPFLPSKYHVENRNEPYLVWLDYLLAQKELPRVISISYADDEKSVPPEYARRVCAEFAKLGARGVSVLVASGDFGVGKSDECQSNDGSGQKRFAPTFPASCPYVTSVGATRLVGPEMVAFDGRSDFASGGGFSEIFARPGYQSMAVEGYLSDLGTRYDGLYNPKGRGIPDVSALGYHYPVVWDGVAHLQDGTSASTPTLAAVIALLNDALLADGRPALGFLNPWIYSQASAGFKDVTFGSNFGCNTSGFDAKKGWDPATGLGTPRFLALKDIALKRRFRDQRPWYYGP